jgi:hypothetical protein
MAIQDGEAKPPGVLYRSFRAGESLIGDLEYLARWDGIREATVTSCIGSLSQLKPSCAVMKKVSQTASDRLSSITSNW